ncbi:MAG TPA: peptidylprolyl isomerase [Candidatus Limnocylindria bacterium]|nr:peptidylprolyl isomerase [Candidatus Limnocylindria bacterium]
MRTKIICFALALLSAVLCAPSFAAEDFAVGPIIAKGEGLEIRRSQLDDAFIAFRANLAARGQSIAESKREGAEAQLLDRMIVTQLLVNKATATDKENAKTNTVKFLADSRRMANSDEDFVRHLKSLGMTQVQFTNRVTEQAVSEEVIMREVKSKITIAEAEMKQFWETNDVAFKQPELARASHILFAMKNFTTDLPLSEADKKAKKAKADAVLERVRKGEDFSELVTAFSEDPGVKENKGEYKFARAKDDPRRAMVPEFEAVAFALKTNEISEVVTTSFGYHIIKLHEIIPPRKVPFEEAKERIREFLMQSALDKQMPEYFATVKKEAGVEILDDKLKATMEKAEKDRAAAKSPVAAKP